MSLWIEIDAVRARWDVRHHPVHESWMAERPADADVALYCGRQARVARALAHAAETLARSSTLGAPELADCARREWTQAEHWQDLAGDGHTLPGVALDDCIAVWSGGEASTDLEALAVLHAVNETRGSVAPSATSAFEAGHDAHSCMLGDVRLGRRHAAITRTIIARAKVTPRAEAELLSHVEAACSAHWDLLDEFHDAMTHGGVLHAV